MAPLLQACLQAFADAMTTNFSVATFNPAQAEDQLKGPMQTLLKCVGEELDLAVVARTEARTDLGVRPDLGVSVDKLLAGHVVFAPVSKEVRNYTVSGFNVIGSWLDYRMKSGAGRQSSRLDEIRLNVWPAAFTEELLELIWVLEHTVAMAPDLNETLADVVARPTVDAPNVPSPTAEERAAPKDG